MCPNNTKPKVSALPPLYMDKIDQNVITKSKDQKSKVKSQNRTNYSSKGFLGAKVRPEVLRLG